MGAGMVYPRLFNLDNHPEIEKPQILMQVHGIQAYSNMHFYLACTPMKGILRILKDGYGNF